MSWLNKCVDAGLLPCSPSVHTWRVWKAVHACGAPVADARERRAQVGLTVNTIVGIGRCAPDYPGQGEG